MNAFYQYLGNHINLTDEEKATLTSKLNQRTYLKGQYIVQAGDVCKYNTYVVKGIVRSFCIGPDDHEHILSFGIENWWVGDLGSFITQQAADFNVQCLAKTEVVQISYEDLEELYLEMPKIERFFRLIIQKAYVNAQKRIITSYSLPARERYLLFCEKYPAISQRVPQYMIASYLGITKEFLSSIRSQIAKSE